MTTTDAATPTTKPHPWHIPLPRRARRVRSADVQGAGINARIGQVVTAAVGTMGAFYFFAIVMGAWMLWQTEAKKPFDPYPFAFLLFLGNIVQLLLMPLIMVGQNLQGRHTEARAESDFEVNVKAEREIETILRHLEYQDERIERILEEIRRTSES